MRKGDKIALVCCSNGQPASGRLGLLKLRDKLTELGLVPVFGDYIFEKDSVFSGSGRERADSLMKFYRDQEIKAIFDISGGDIANEILPYLDFDSIADSGKMFWGYSDLTTIINAIYTRTGCQSVLYQIKNIVLEDSENQSLHLKETILEGKETLFRIPFSFLQKEKMQGIVVGGNIRCLLKLAGTKYWPDMNGKILLLEARSGGVPQMVAYLNQLQQIGVFEKIAGILLGTYTEMEKTGAEPNIVDLIKQYAREELPIAYTSKIGHGSDSMGIVIGRNYEFKGCGRYGENFKMCLK